MFYAILATTFLVVIRIGHIDKVGIANTKQVKDLALRFRQRLSCKIIEILDITIKHILRLKNNKRLVGFNMSQDIMSIQLETLTKALKEQKYIFEPLSGGGGYNVGFTNSKNNSNWDLNIIIFNKKDTENVFFKLDFHLFELKLSNFSLMDKLLVLLNSINSKILMGKFLLDIDFNVYFKLNVDVTGSNISTTTIKHWISLGNHSIETYYERIKEICDMK